MQLLKIKMAGFKSFVDPTTVVLPSHLVAVVGPNGCGKSNIIDAVIWVMGESSPKYLRGETQTDIIFNGSNSRKPIGQASVELIFDNTDGSMGGEYGKFAEVSIKRIINRASDSIYYLNGVRCRKRDVVDIFLGTGLGPRSYSIIGQNMISRIIEAKPDELRGYLEEAAGISKYKERRQETERRIQHTKENVARVNDLRTELEKQLNHLKHQATVAEKYKSFKQQERIWRAELYGIQWRQFDYRMVEHTLKIQREETALEARQSALISTDHDIEQLRHEQRVAQDAFQEVQRRYYSVGNEITRIEQDILHHQERQQQWENDLNQTEQDWQNIKHQVTESDGTLCDLERDMQLFTPKLTAAKEALERGQADLTIAEEAMQEGQNRWDEFNQSSAKTAQTAQVEKTHIQHLEQRIAFLQKRQVQLQQDRDQFNFSALNKEIEELTKQSYEVTEQLDFLHKGLEDLRKESSILYATQQDSNTNLDSARNELQRLCGRQASLEALQQTALGQRDNPTVLWLAKHDLNSKPRLAQKIEVDQGWELAVETVLGYCLQAICVDRADEILTHVNELASGNLCVFTPTNDSSKDQRKKGDLLLQKVKSNWSLDSLLGGVYIADSLHAALDLSKSLDVHESVITKEGIWLNQAWLKILREKDPTVGVFQREQELKQLVSRIDHLRDTQAQLEKSIANRHEHIHNIEQQREHLQQQYNQQQAKSAQMNAQRKMKQERLAELKIQAERFMNEYEDCSSQLKQANTDMSQSRSLWQDAMNEMEKQTVLRDSLMTERDKARQQVQLARHHVNHKKEEIHEIEIRLQANTSQKSTLQQTVSRLQAQMAALSDRKISLQSDLTSMPPLESLKKFLSRSLDKHVSIETELNSARMAMESLDQEFRNLENNRHIIDRDINKVRHALEALRVEWQGWKVKTDTLIEQIKETEFTLEGILKELPQDISLEEWQGKLEQIVQRIQRLGPINLVAIDEYAICLERKQYLDKQLEDLQAGLSTLDDAIAKIDKETRARFKETFDQVNGRFQELFPIIFGGGKAYLELTSDNLLEAGMTMLACPPGKRNSSIYLLSGGEKALTAIAFIFSIFRLNPAPFCLLDEVDAALDDANVLRFTRLVKSMADRTQFIFISHNKTTIEMAEHLIGVTMNEPGVSRLVSVDIEKAITLATET